MLRKRIARVADIPRLVELHMRNFDPDELSVRLGPRAVAQYYLNAVRSDDTYVLVGDSDDDGIFCFAVGFTKYRDFEGRLARSILLPALVRIGALLASLRIGEVVSLLKYNFEKRTRIDGPASQFHLGLICLDKESGRSPSRIRLFADVYSDVVAFVKSRGRGHCWTSVFADNRSSVRFIKSVMKPDEEFVLRELPKRTIGLVCRPKNDIQERR